MINTLKKFIFILILFCFINNCTYINSQDKASNTNLIINTSKDKYNILLNNELQKLTKSLLHKNKYYLLAEIKYKVKDVLSVRGLKSLTEIEGSVSYKLTNAVSNKLIKDGKILKKINFGSISSLYGKDENSNHVKERLAKSLSKNIYNQIILYLN